ncbi:c-type cytochrome [Glaciimonas sp. PAMC28666]|uniref:SorB family sulfite dehydrogenase c-type cytochrome subunit n=1 Tax=Glaciimonas sp. PAMC28666 TaxID=2807626 RepID=UPI001964BC9D|nr:c-type cytochrome [Glaciimonas sp. PAMC28666]QRX82952.1 c-type cytochrome [Glaciimonas sp. PAMC28666]
MKKLSVFSLSLLVLSIPVIGFSASASAKEITLPPETIAWRESPLPGYQKVLQACMICHSAHYAEYQPTSTPRSYWETQVKRMKMVFNAPVADADVALITDYLVNTYSVARTSPPPTQSAAALPVAAVTPVPPASGKVQDVNVLLQNNACLSCHAIEKKVVGPAYRDVALKYASDKDAVSKVMANIRSGGSGRWGAVPMPSYAALSPDELRSLADFVLKQK